MGYKPILPTKRRLIEQDEQQIPSLKISRITPKDRFSDLPNVIIHHILSFGTVEDAIKICSLSKQWKSLWTSISNLSFLPQQKNITDFASFVDKALTLYSAPKLKTFLLEFGYDDRFKRIFKSWIRFSANHEVEELCLHFTEYEALFYKKGFDFFDNWSGMSLKLVSLANLRLGVKMIRDIFRGSPLMEHMKLHKCLLIKSVSSNFLIDATNTRLKSLVLDSCFQVECRQKRRYFVSRKGCIEIRGPDLVSLSVKGYMSYTKLKLVDVSSLVEANIGFRMLTYTDKGNEKKTFVKNLLQKLLHVDRLAIGIWFLQVLRIASLDGEIFPPFRWKILEMDISLSTWYYPVMEFLLQIAPSLEQLIINVVPHEYDISNVRSYKYKVEENYWRSKARTMWCLNHNLKRVEIAGIVIDDPSWNCSKILVEVVQFLLDNASVLQKMTVYAQVDDPNTSLESIEQTQVDDPNRSLESIEPTKLQKLLEIKEKLLHFPRVSPDAVVVFKSAGLL